MICVMVAALVLATAAGGATEQDVEVVPSSERYSAPATVAVGDVEILRGGGGFITSSGTDYTSLVIIRPGCPVWGFLYKGGSFAEEPKPLYSWPTATETHIGIGSHGYDASKDVILLMWCETPGVATPWGELYQDERGKFGCRSPAVSVPAGLSVNVPQPRPRD